MVRWNRTLHGGGPPGRSEEEEPRQMKKTGLAIALLSLAALPARSDDAASPGGAFKSVAELRKAHDRALVRDLNGYLKKNPKAEDRDQAYMAIFDTAIEHDWFAENEPAAERYL